MTDVAVELPGVDEAPRCAEFARSNQIDPGGTALAPDVVVLVEVAEPWPKPVGKHSSLTDLVAAAAAEPEQIRLLAALPHDPAAPRVIAFRPTATAMTRTERPLSGDPVADLTAVLRGVHARDVGADERTMLVCTQGSHDICCGTDGAAFAAAIEAARSDIELFRVSHTGGHRFSPTAMTLPDGRMWAYLDADLAGSIIDRTLEPEAGAAHCRGWWGTPTGPTQIAERAALAHLGWQVDQSRREIYTEQRDDGSHCVTVSLATDAGLEIRGEVVVELGRDVPTIACEQPGGEPIKAGREWRVRSVAFD